MMGAHLLRAGTSRILIDLLRRGFIDHIAMNGAGAIHDFELARIGATTESVARYIQSGEFGLWRETGELNDWIAEAAALGLGLGENAGRRLSTSNWPHVEASVLAAAYELSIPVTIHVGIGYDILHEHPNCDGAALGAASYRDFLIFANTVERLENGVMLSFGSAIMAPEVYLKALAMSPQRGPPARPQNPQLHHCRLRSGSYRRRHSPRTYQSRPRLLFPPAQNHPGPHRGRWRRKFLYLRPAPRHSPRAPPRTPGSMTIPEIIAGIPRLRILVIGDICLDRWCTYDPRHREASRETGLDRIAVVSTIVTPGGGGTVASNLAALGAQVSVLGVAGDDGSGFELARALAERGIGATHLIRSPALQTFTYTKLINSGTGIEDQPRVDFIHSQRMPANLEAQLIHGLHENAANCDAIIALDQSETPAAGVITATMRYVLANLPVDKLVWADSRIRAELFRNLTMKVNRQEAAEACARLNIPLDYAALRDKLQAPSLFVTSGAGGVHIATTAGLHHVPTRPIENPVDICGAGDSFSAGAVCALAQGATEPEAAHFGNLVASITVMKPGTGTASPAELLAALSAPQ